MPNATIYFTIEFFTTSLQHVSITYQRESLHLIDMFHVLELRFELNRQSSMYRGTILLVHLLRSKLLTHSYQRTNEKRTL